MKLTGILTMIALAGALCLLPAVGQQNWKALFKSYTETYEKTSWTPEGAAGRELTRRDWGPGAAP